MKSNELILRPKKSNTIFLALVCLGFIIIGFTIMGTDELITWIGIAFFGLGFLVCIIQLIPNSAQLKLTKEGFTTTSLFIGHFTKWEDVKAFKLGHLGSETVLYDYIDDHDKYNIGKSISKSISKSHAAFPITYGMEAIDLLHLLNEWKRKSHEVL